MSDSRRKIGAAARTGESFGSVISRAHGVHDIGCLEDAEAGGRKRVVEHGHHGLAFGDVLARGLGFFDHLLLLIGHADCHWERRRATTFRRLKDWSCRACVSSCASTGLCNSGCTQSSRFTVLVLES